MTSPIVSRRAFLTSGATTAAAALLTPDRLLGATPEPAAATSAPASPLAPFELDELTIADLQQGMASGRWTSRRLCELYLDRIAQVDKSGPTLNAVIELNPDALAIADALDAERRVGTVRGPMHGIPVLIKDNIATRDRMETTAGSLALVGSRVPRDAHVVERLRGAGAVILGKTNLSEWANFRSTHSTSGWSARGGQTRNPYALDRTPSGSSSGSGSATAANLCAVAVGTETDGSVTSPAASAALVGVKPTLGLVSRSGIVPIAHSQDTAGPMARTVRDAAILLAAVSGIDARDAETAKARGHVVTDYTPFLKTDALRGARLGVVRERHMGYSRATDALMEEAIARLKSLGAVIVDPTNIPNTGKYDDAEFEVLLYEFKADLDAYLRGLESSRVRSLAGVIAFNREHAAEEMPYFGQEIMEMAQAKGPLTSAKYRAARAKCVALTRAGGIDAEMKRHRLDALIAPTQAPAWLIDLVNGDPGGIGGFTSPAAVAGYPHVTVPMGEYRGLPVGLSFVGRAWSEGTLLGLAYAWEQSAKARKAPTFAATAAV